MEDPREDLPYFRDHFNISPAELKTQFRYFADAIRDEVLKHDIRTPFRYYGKYVDTIPGKGEFREAFEKGEMSVLLCKAFMQTIQPREQDTGTLSRHSYADLTNPHEWYRGARMMKRKVFLHVGPTNSGKTYRALKRLEECGGSGAYAGPLRLLAHEIYERFNAKGIQCNLVTGEEMRTESEFAPMTSSTIEMMSCSKPYKVAVIDEIQKIGDTERGWAWTQAVLGVQAEELHLCGEDRTVELIKKMCDLTGDELHISRYERLGPLSIEKESLRSDPTKVRAGDCIVAFSRKRLFELKKVLENTTGRKCAIIYGKLPPETRSQQAQLFNDPDNDYDFLVASDAIGMGLNLSVKRIIFDDMSKFNGKEMVTLEPSDVRQIAGRAGRYKVAPSRAIDPNKAGDEGLVIPGKGLPQTPLPPTPSVGYVTTLHSEDFRALKAGMDAPPSDISAGGLLPTSKMVEWYAALCPSEWKFSTIMENMYKSLTTSGLFFICDLEKTIECAKSIDDIEGLSHADRLTVCMAPINVSRKPELENFYKQMIRQIASGKVGSILALENFDIDFVDLSTHKLGVIMPNNENLLKLETIHETVSVWLWLHYRFPFTLIYPETAFAIKEECEARIATILEDINRSKKQLTKKRWKATTADKAAEEAKVTRPEEGMIEDQAEHTQKVVAGLEIPVARQPEAFSTAN